MVMMMLLLMMLPPLPKGRMRQWMILT